MKGLMEANRMTLKQKMRTLTELRQMKRNLI